MAQASKIWMLWWQYWIVPAMTPPGRRAMNQASVRRNWRVLSIHGCPHTSGTRSGRLWVA